jgi:8-hydroxy-5-deazaflavin:NADPH oxidoreductase
MKIGSIGAGNMGASMGMAWAAQGHTVCFSFAKDPNKLRSVAAAAGPHARTGTPAEAVAFGDVIVLAVPWGAITEALHAAGAMHGRGLFSCVNCLKPDCSGLAVGTTSLRGRGNGQADSWGEGGGGPAPDGRHPRL